MKQKTITARVQGLLLASMSPVTGGYLDIEIFGCFDIWIIGNVKKDIRMKSKDKRACVREGCSWLPCHR